MGTARSPFFPFEALATPLNFLLSLGKERIPQRSSNLSQFSCYFCFIPKLSNKKPYFLNIYNKYLKYFENRPISLIFWIEQSIMLSKNMDDNGLTKSLFVRLVIISIAKNIAESASVNRAGTKFKDRGIKRKTNKMIIYKL